MAGKVSIPPLFLLVVDRGSVFCRLSTDGNVNGDAPADPVDESDKASDVDVNFGNKDDDLEDTTFLPLDSFTHFNFETRDMAYLRERIPKAYSRRCQLRASWW
jgi:hypothetical protein